MRSPRTVCASVLGLLAIVAACGQAADSGGKQSNDRDPAASEPHPEAFCEKWVSDSCHTLASCCTSGEFDATACQIGLSESCMTSLEVEKAHSGEVVFDEKEAGQCFGKASCEGPSASTPSFDQQKACADMVTGFRTTGEECSASTQCKKAGAYSTCYTGTGTQGVCAAVVQDAKHCGFDVSDWQLHVCADGTFCDVTSVPNPNDSPAAQALDFSGDCKPFLGAGQTCAANGKITPCAASLYCDVEGGTNRCTARKAKGDSCTESDECRAGLACDATGTCDTANGPFCVKPSVCGDGTCDGAETVTSCPEDCAACGDGICSSTEDSTSCPQDCQPVCGDGTCDSNETPANCPQDCTVCGDGLCSGNETFASCPQDCMATCGDGFCGLGESPTCLVDCCGDGVCQPGETISCPGDCP